MRPSTIPGASATHSGALPSVVKKRSAAAAGAWRFRVGRTVLAVRVVVVAAAALAPETAGGDHPHRDRRRPPPRLAEALLIERARHLEPNVDPDQVHQLERAHPEAAAEA